MNMCSTVASLAVPVSSEQHDGRLSSDLGEDLWLTWNVPDCQGCEARGGTSGFENSTSSNILCFTDQSTGLSGSLKIFKINAFSLVIPVVTCSIFVSCFAIIVVWRSTGSTIESYTKVVLGESRRLPGPNGSTCPICLADYHAKDMVRHIPECEACFHSDCIDEWLRMQNTCPVCWNPPSVNQDTIYCNCSCFSICKQSFFCADSCTHIKELSVQLQDLKITFP